MPLEESILKSTKKILGLDDAYTAFDLDVITHINMAFFRLHTLGLGPSNGYSIFDETSKWEEFDTAGLNSSVLSAVKTYVFLKVRIVFDPPGTPHHIAAMQAQITELEHLMLMENELVNWAGPDTLPGLDGVPVAIQGGSLDD